MTTTASRMGVLGRQECLALLATVPTGWLAFTTVLRPRLVLVNIALRGHHVVLRTGPGEAVTAAENGAVMSVGVSCTDEATRTGWSVTVTGTARLLGPLLDGGTTGDAPLHPWAPGTKDHVLAIEVEDVSGRRVSAGTALGTGEASWGWWG